MEDDFIDLDRVFYDSSLTCQQNDFINDFLNDPAVIELMNLLERQYRPEIVKTYLIGQYLGGKNRVSIERVNFEINNVETTPKPEI